MTHPSSVEDLEAALRFFVLVKRAKSKLNPASTYLSNIISDIELLVGANAIVAQAEIVHAKGDLDVVRPVLERMRKSWEALEEALEAVEEHGVNRLWTLLALQTHPWTLIVVDKGATAEHRIRTSNRLSAYASEDPGLWNVMWPSSLTSPWEELDPTASADLRGLVGVAPACQNIDTFCYSKKKLEPLIILTHRRLSQFWNTHPPLY